ncbi:hypothetical protein Tco_0966886 [Tanacetum coccineum]
MAVLESCPKHNMVAYLEKTDGNAEFHEIIDFLTRSSIHHALTVSPVVSTTFVEQFWTSAKSKIINNVRHITAKVAGKPVSISEASIRSDLLFNDANGIDSLPNQAIFDAIQLMGVNISQGKSPLYLLLCWYNQLRMRVLHSESPSEPQLHLYSSLREAYVKTEIDPSPRPSPTPHIPDSIPEVSGGNQGGQSSSDRSLSGTEGGMTLQSVYDLCISLCTQVTDQAKEIKHLKAQIKKLKKQAKPVITHHRSWMKSVSLKQRLAGKKSLKSNWMQKESVSKQGRKSAKAEPSVHKDPLFDELDDDEIDNINTEDAQDVGRTRDGMNAEKEGTEDAVSTEDVVSTDKEKVSTDRSNEGTDKEKEGTDKEKDSTISLDEGTDDRTEARSATPTTPTTTQTTTPTMFGDDETIAQDEEMARKLQEDWETEEERKRLAEEEATKTALSDEYDFIQARIEADRLLALRLQDEERERAVHSIAIRNKPPTRTQLRNQMMTYLKHVGNKKHSDLKSKTFEEIQALYEKVKRFDESFTAVGSTEDERRIKEMNEGVKP